MLSIGRASIPIAASIPAIQDPSLSLLHAMKTNAKALAKEAPTTPHPVRATCLFVIILTMSHDINLSAFRQWNVKVQATANLVGILKKAGQLPTDAASDATDTSSTR